jgi:hypothetical protein
MEEERGKRKSEKWEKSRRRRKVKKEEKRKRKQTERQRKTVRRGENEGRGMQMIKLTIKKHRKRRNIGGELKDE